MTNDYQASGTQPNNAVPTPIWLKEIENTLGQILRVVEGCPPEHRPKLFELLVTHALMQTGPARREQVPPDDGRGGRKSGLEEFLAELGISSDSLAAVLDVESGDVHVRDLKARTASDKQRKLAALIAATCYAQGRGFIVPRQALQKKCEDYSIYDVDHFARNMRKAVYARAAVFAPTSDGWRVTKPGEGFVADVLKELVALREST